MNQNQPTVAISSDLDTERFLKGLLIDVDDVLLDDLTIHREMESTDGMAGEPATLAVVVTAGTIAMSAFLRLVERRLEQMHQREEMKIVAEGFARDSQLGGILADIAKKHADVSISFGIAKEAWLARPANKDQ